MPVESEAELRSWLELQTPEMCILFSTRSAARVFPLVARSLGSNETLALLTGRALLTSAVSARMPSPKTKTARVLALAAATAEAASNPKASDVVASDLVAGSIAYAANAAYSDFVDTAKTAEMAASAAGGFLQLVEGTTFVEEHADRQLDIQTLFNLPLWSERDEPNWLRMATKECNNFWESSAGWAFWRRWYHGLLVGQPLDWELQRRVALIENDIWEAGPEAVADEISRIEAELAAEPLAQDTRFPEFEPTFVNVLFRNRVVAGTQTLQLAQQIEDSIARFHAETGLNQLPEAFQPLERMPRTLTRIGAVLTHEAQTPETEQRLREEIGRLSARVAELEKELAAAQKSGEPIFAPAFKQQAGKSLGDWKLYATLCAGLWVVSGDSVEMQTRLENLLGLREALFGDVCPSPKVAPFAAPSHAIKT